MWCEGRGEGGREGGDDQEENIAGWARLRVLLWYIKDSFVALAPAKIFGQCNDHP
jgi:hypothetical protein